MAREQQQGGRGGDLEHRDRSARVGALAFGQRIGELVVGGETSRPTTLQGGAETEAFVEAHEVRRRIGMHSKAGGFQDRAHERDGRALAVGAGDVDDRRQAPLRMAERSENAPHALEREIDPLGMQRQEPRDDGIDLAHAMGMGVGPAQACAGTGKLPVTSGAGDLVNSRHRLDSVARNRWRCTTMSTMPCSLRYSAR